VDEFWDMIKYLLLTVILMALIILASAGLRWLQTVVN
jgi:hypothetical protein